MKETQLNKPKFFMGKKRHTVQPLCLQSKVQGEIPLHFFVAEINCKKSNYTLCNLKNGVIIDTHCVTDEGEDILWIAVKR